MTIGRKLSLTYGGAMLLMGALIYSNLSALSRMDSVVMVSTMKSAPKLELFGIINTAKSDMFAAQRGVVLFNIVKNQERIDSAVTQFQESHKKLRAALTQVRPMLLTTEGKQLCDTIDSGVANWEPYFREILRLSNAGHTDQAISVVLQKTLPTYYQISAAVDRLNEIMHTLVEADRTAAAAEYSFSRTGAWVLSAIAAGLGLFALFTVRKINRSLRQIATRMADNASQVASAAVQIASGSSSLAQGATEQSATLEETSASSQEINAMIQQNYKDSSAAAECMGDTAGLISRADEDLMEMTKSMHELRVTSDKMAQIIRAIDEIAFQTNILALNAAIEAARAGEAGLSFAVVADEVRSLAQRSGKAAQDTAALIGESVEKSTECTARLEQVSGVVQSLIESANRVKALTDGVSRGSDEQARGMDQITKALAQLEQVTQQTAASTEESAAAGQQLSAQTLGMQAVVDELRTMVGHDAGAAGL